MRLGWHVARMGAKRGVYRVLVGKPEGKRPLGRPTRRWKDNIKMDLQEIGYEVWTGSIWLRIGTGHLWMRCILPNPAIMSWSTRTVRFSSLNPLLFKINEVGVTQHFVTNGGDHNEKWTNYIKTYKEELCPFWIFPRTFLFLYLYHSQDLVSGILRSGSDILSINLLANSITRSTVEILLYDSWHKCIYQCET